MKPEIKAPGTGLDLCLMAFAGEASEGALGRTEHGSCQVVRFR